MNIFKKLFGTPQYVSQTDTTGDSPDPDPNDVWAFTDPDARDTYEQKGQLRELEQDIRFEVMRGEPWLPEELAYKQEIRRLLQEETIRDKGTYWFTSPFPTVYRAAQNGSLTIGGESISFKRGDDIVFQCRMTRDVKPELTAPVLVDRLQPTNTSQFCGNMGGAMKGMGGRM